MPNSLWEILDWNCILCIVLRTNGNYFSMQHKFNDLYVNANLCGYCSVLIQSLNKIQVIKTMILPCTRPTNHMTDGNSYMCTAASFWISKRPLSSIAAPAKEGFLRDWQHSKAHTEPWMACGFETSICLLSIHRSMLAEIRSRKNNEN